MCRTIHASLSFLFSDSSFTMPSWCLHLCGHSNAQCSYTSFLENMNTHYSLSTMLKLCHEFWIHVTSFIYLHACFALLKVPVPLQPLLHFMIKGLGLPPHKPTWRLIVFLKNTVAGDGVVISCRSEVLFEGSELVAGGLHVTATKQMLLETTKPPWFCYDVSIMPSIKDSIHSDRFYFSDVVGLVNRIQSSVTFVPLQNPK